MINSEKAKIMSISITIANTLNRGVNIKLIEHIYGDWVVRNASSNYLKVDASTIHFPLSISEEILAKRDRTPIERNGSKHIVPEKALNIYSPTSALKGIGPAKFSALKVV